MTDLVEQITWHNAIHKNVTINPNTIPCNNICILFVDYVLDAPPYTSLVFRVTKECVT